MKPRENILVIRLKSIGDVLFTLPAVHALRDNFPDANITFLNSKENASLLCGFREVNGAIVLDRTVLPNPFRAAPEIFRLLRRLRREQFSLAVDFQGYGETAWLCWWSGAPARWGNVYSGGREWLYTSGIRRDEQIHLADWNLSLLRQCGLRVGEIRNEFVIPEDALAEAKKFFARNNLDSARPTLFLQPFTSSPHKNWPLENFLALARH
ncbi:MAG TPA: glycosyltransferase family 9 protein, partial [Verrucomicrobiae bacterium]|nr:glycosyltransferase family 9 protein [Verrucomicrobiae bacterium]